ncbi:hypothetical protein DVH24_035870 [Malus domestica]|uniref:Uncharacterized protein n=1 Tax=Malus domestica TaxID=3750 RepID=A0A498JUI9_MALDO|nr:hypothetical protein DVH24_035870 [Malus domestica]
MVAVMVNHVVLTSSISLRTSWRFETQKLGQTFTEPASPRMVEQCVAGARIGCAINGSEKCKPPWWRALIGQKALETTKCKVQSSNGGSTEQIEKIKRKEKNKKQKNKMQKEKRKNYAFFS